MAVEDGDDDDSAVVEEGALPGTVRVAVVDEELGRAEKGLSELERTRNWEVLDLVLYSIVHKYVYIVHSLKRFPIPG